MRQEKRKEKKTCQGKKALPNGTAAQWPLPEKRAAKKEKGEREESSTTDKKKKKEAKEGIGKDRENTAEASTQAN